VFFFTGLWHGADWTFIIWGLYHGLFLILEGTKLKTIATKAFAVKQGQKCSATKSAVKSVFQYSYVMLVVTTGFAIFRADGIKQMLTLLGKMFTDFAPMSSLAHGYFLQNFSPLFIFTLVLAFILSLPAKNLLTEKFKSHGKLIDVTGYIASVPLLLLCIMSLSASSFNPFIYFRF
jgi:alginate O-acetyltransferase complex protein AlgI